MSNDKKPFIHVGEAARLLNVSERTVWRLLAAKKLPGTKLGGTWIISRARLIQHVEDEISRRLKSK